MPSKKDFKRAALVIYEDFQLEKIKRSVRYLNLYAEGSSVGEHTGTTVKIAWLLAKLAEKKNSTVNLQKILEYVIWHDTEETRTLDIPIDVRKYVVINEDKALTEKFSGVGWGNEIIRLKGEFEKNKEDINPHLARDADFLYVILTIKAFVKSGIAIHEPNERIKRTLACLKTKVGQELGTMLATMDPGEWWNRAMGYKTRPK